MSRVRWMLYLLIGVPMCIRQAVALPPTETIVVTGTNAESPAIYAPFALDVLRKERLAQDFVRSIPEALAQVPGVLVQKTAPGQGSPYIRGFTGYRTLALIDGIRYNNSVYRDGPNEYFGLIDLQAIAALEVLRGPASTRFGSDAVGGALNLATQRSRFVDETAGGFFQHGLQRYQFSTADNGHLSRTEFDLGRGQRWGLHAGYTYKDVDDLHAAGIGTQPRTGYAERAADFRLDINVTPSWTVTGLHQRLSQDDVWRTHATVFGRSFNGSTIGTDSVRSKDQSRRLTYIRAHGRDLHPALAEVRATVSHQAWNERGERVRASRQGLHEGFKSNMSGLDLALASHLGAASLHYGVDYYRDNVDSVGTRFSPRGEVVGDNVQGPIGDDASYEMFGTYVQADLLVAETWNLLAGTRLTHIDVAIGRFEDPTTGQPASLKDNWSEAVHSIRAAWDVGRDGRHVWWAGASQAFRAPNVADLSRFGASRSTETEIAASGLSPESFLTYELGWKGNRQRWAATATGFYTRIHDYIASTPTGRIVEGLIEVSKRNSASGYVHGVELTGRYDLTPRLTLDANLTWQEGRLDNYLSTAAQTAVREPLSRIMPLSLHSRLQWTRRDARAWLALGLTLADDAHHLSEGDRNDTERIPPGGTPGYTLAYLRGGYTLTPHLELSAGLENLFDEVYRTHGSGSNEAGFGAIVGITLKF